jgi:hypothetical protein
MIKTKFFIFHLLYLLPALHTHLPKVTILLESRQVKHSLAVFPVKHVPHEIWQDRQVLFKISSKNPKNKKKFNLL